VVDTNDPPVISVTKIQDSRDMTEPISWKCGLTEYNAFGAFPHVFFESNPAYAMEWLKRIPGWQPPEKDTGKLERKPL